MWGNLLSKLVHAPIAFFPGYRDIKIFVYNDRSEDPNVKEGTLSDSGSVHGVSDTKGCQQDSGSDALSHGTGDSDRTLDSSKRIQGKSKCQLNFTLNFWQKIILKIFLMSKSEAGRKRIKHGESKCENFQLFFANW